jgi:hypothetical protein
LALSPVSKAALLGSLRIDAVGYDHPDAARLIEEVQQEYVVRYGGRDDSPLVPAGFAPPAGLFLVGYPAASLTPDRATTAVPTRVMAASPGLEGL